MGAIRSTLALAFNPPEGPGNFLWLLFHLDLCFCPAFIPGPLPAWSSFPELCKILIPVTSHVVLRGGKADGRETSEVLISSYASTGVICVNG